MTKPFFPTEQRSFSSNQQIQTRVLGAELEGRWNIGQGLSVCGSYTRLDAKFRRSIDAASVGKRVALVPKQSTSPGADYTFTAGALSGFGFGACVRHNGGIYGHVYNDWYTPSFTLIDASVHYERGPWRLQANAANTADKVRVGIQQRDLVLLRLPAHRRSQPAVSAVNPDSPAAVPGVLKAIVRLH